jgi:hypothetical protein
MVIRSKIGIGGAPAGWRGGENMTPLWSSGEKPIKFGPWPRAAANAHQHQFPSAYTCGADLVLRHPDILVRESSQRRRCIKHRLLTGLDEACVRSIKI